MLPNIASESLQAQFVSMCSSLNLAPRQAVLLALIWQSRVEHETRQMQDAMLGIIEFAPDALPCEGQCPHRKVTLASTSTHMES